jgi:hypothetical protein
MPIKDGNPSQNITATVDPNAVAQIVRTLQKQDADAARQQEKKNLFQNKVKSLLSSDKVDKENLAELTDLIEAKAADLKDELGSATTASGAQTIQSRYNEAVADALEPYIGDDEQLGKCDKLLVNNVFEKLKQMPDVVAKFNAGELDKRQIKTIAKEVVETFSKDVLKRDIQAKGVSMGGAVSGAAANSAIENDNTTDSIYEIPTEHQRTAALKLKSFLSRAGVVTNDDGSKRRMSEREANQKAYSMAMSYKKGAGR